MAPIEVGQTIPEGTFAYVEYSPELEDPSVCGKPGQIKTSQWAGKKVVVFGVPGAFTPTCSENHLPPYVQAYDQFKAKGVDAIYCIASNDVFVMSAWGRALHTTDKVTTIADSSLAWLKAAGLTQDLSHVGFGERSARFAAIIDDLKVTYIGIESGGGVSASGADAVLAKL
ncbi:Redoxin [Leucosporidium creatinivorum]|uniref:Putative peroxiredoxin n=1 Tax=Leucosporidium creatinivorum TaxID=106004 RepID=A0A1Y2DFG6_9BASI|nr:Redoxin [Leucosporidium creatinivorum]